MPLAVCMLTTSFPRWPGDFYGTFVKDLACGVLKCGLEVKAVAVHCPGSKKYELFDGVKVHRPQYLWPERWEMLQQGERGVLAMLRSSFIAWIELVPFTLSYFFKALQVCRACGVIHVHWTQLGLIAIVIGKLLDKPVVLTVHGSDVNQVLGIPLLARINEFVFDRVDRIITVSADLAGKVRRMGGKETKIQIIRNGVDLTQFTPLFTPQGSEIVWVGRMVPVKGLEYLIKAMSIVVRAVPEAKLTLVGDGPLRPVLESHVEELGLTNVVRFVGLTHHSEVIEYLQSSSILVLPSLSEGCPLVVLEAFAAGTPVVASRVGGIPEVVVEGETGLLVSPTDSALLAKAIIELLRDSQKRERFARAGRSFVERELGWDSVATETCQVYLDVSGGDGHGVRLTYAP